jgi:flagellar motor switch protein FliM
MTSLVPSIAPIPRSGPLVGEASAAPASLHAMADQGTALSRSLRKAVPFFSRRGVVVSAESPKVMFAPDVVEALTRPGYVAPLVAEPGGTRAALGFDGPAIAFLLEGSLGGDGSMIPELDEEGLSVAQLAFIARLAQGVANTLSTTLSEATGVKLTPLPKSTGDAAGGALVTMTFGLFDPNAENPDEPVGRILLAISKHALLTTKHRRDPRLEPDERVVSALKRTEVDVIAELGRVMLPLSDVARLLPGDVLRLGIPVEGGTIDVRVDGHVLFSGRPTTCGSQLAVRIEGNEPIPQPASLPAPVVAQP